MSRLTREELDSMVHMASKLRGKEKVQLLIVYYQLMIEYYQDKINSEENTNFEKWTKLIERMKANKEKWEARL